jgi:hypothetical protein
MTSASSPTTTALNTATAGATDMPAVSQGVSIQVYEDLVPPFVESALEQLYGNLFSSLAHRRVFGTMQKCKHLCHGEWNRGCSRMAVSSRKEPDTGIE